MNLISSFVHRRIDIFPPIPLCSDSGAKAASAQVQPARGVFEDRNGQAWVRFWC